ncbi:TPA: hypothetical protein L3H12_002139 [Acinetobacter baumannii]|uniref:hypothetical protein n=1 Tax=Acinetobacter baumannii TaxID=470 RepID=UPI000465C3CA|nr:hypothetical protein [Acinetobacter baumannii]RSP29942.1 hypothetical protein EA730_16580 [Acinetobacter baumannii]HBN5965418.1 hypothetical protein [Acinetobacter baumannii]
MNTDKRLEMYIKEYHFELEQKEKIFGRLALILVVLTACLGAISATAIPKYKSLLLAPFISTITVIITITLIICFIFIIFHIIRFLSAKNDELIPSPKEIENYYNQLEEYFNKKNEHITETEYVDKKFSNFLLQAYVAATSTTYDNNCFKLKCLNRCYELIVIFVISTLILCSFPIYISDNTPEENKMSQNTPTLPQEPTPPSNRIIRSDTSIAPEKPQTGVSVNIKIDNTSPQPK